MLEVSVDRIGESVGTAGAVEFGQDAGGPFLQRPPECDYVPQGFRDALALGVDHRRQHRMAFCPVRFAVGGDSALIDRAVVTVILVPSHPPAPRLKLKHSQDGAHCRSVQAGAIAVSTTVSSSEIPAALRISMKSAIMAAVTSWGSPRVALSANTEMLSWST